MCNEVPSTAYHRESMQSAGRCKLQPPTLRMTYRSADRLADWIFRILYAVFLALVYPVSARRSYITRPRK